MRHLHHLFISILIYILLPDVSVFGQQLTGVQPGQLLNVRMPAAKTGSLKPVRMLANQGGTAGSILVNDDLLHTTMTPEQLVQESFITGCLKAENIKFGYYTKSGSSWIWHDHVWGGTENRQMGYFTKGASSFPISEGIVLSTGIASSAQGPNDTPSKSDLMIPGASDPDLSAISGQDMNDAAVLEFDFVPAGNTMEFKYMFSSEEYLEYVNSAFNDAFGFFLSGPGISGTYKNNAVNLAVLPNGDPVTVNTIHPAGTNIAGQAYGAKNEGYYLDNPPGSVTYQFDGGTVVLTASYPVVPCQTYHIKLCVADAYDQEYDGAVFLAAKSFNSENVVLNNFGNAIQGLDNIFEGCSNSFRIQRSSPDLSDALDLDLVLSGTAVNGVDIQTTGGLPFPSHVTIPAGAADIDIPYTAVADGIPNNGKTFDIKIATSCPCAASVVYVEKTLTIYENFALNSVVATDALCHDQNSGTITVNASGGTGNFEYSKNNGLNWQKSNVFSNLLPGTYTILVRDPGSCYPPASGTATVANPPAIIANAGSAVTICSGKSTQLNGSGGALYSWSPATGLSATNIANPIASPSTGTTYTLTATNALGQCPSTSTVTVSVNASPTASISQLNTSVCKGSGTVLTAGGGNSYVWAPGGETTATINVAPLITTRYTVTALSNNGCSDTTSVSVAVLDAPVMYNVTGGGSYCAGGSGVAVGLSGSQTGVSYQLKLNGTNTGAAVAGTGAAISFGNQLLAGTYTVDATTTATSCLLPMNGNVVVVVNAVPAAPAVGSIVQTTCVSSTGSVVLNGLPASTWTLNPGSISGSGGSYTISGLSAGTYNYTVTNALGCPSPASANIVINVQPVTPTPPTLVSIVQPTCSVATGSKTLGGLPAGNWVLNPGAIAGTGSSFTVTGLTPGVYAFTVTNAVGCVSSPSGNFTILPQPATPLTPVVGTITQPTCGNATGSLVLSGLPAGTWTINPGGFTGSGSSTTLTGIAVGTYNFTVTNSSGCTSPATANVVFTAATPSAPTLGTITQPTCSLATGSAVLNNLPSGNWTINPGNISGATASFTISGLIAGTYNYTVTNTLGCTSLASANIVINVQPATPTAPIVGLITHPTCATSTGSVVLNGLPAGNWVINPGAIAGTGASKTISGLVAGTYTFTVTNDAGCISPASANVVINTQPVTPSALIVGTITQPTCSVATGSVVLSGFPAGNWTLNPGAIAGSTPTTTLSNLTAGTYTYTVTNAVGCTSPATINIAINAQPSTPSAPLAGAILQPTCALATGSVTLNNLPAGSWTINPGAIPGSGASKTLSGLVPGTYTYTVTNASGCTSPASASIVINAQPVTPAAPILGAATQPTCSVATGTKVLSGLPAGNWILNPGTIAGTGATYTLTGLTSGTYAYTVTNDVGCVSASSASFTVQPQPVTPTAPGIGTLTQPTCSVATGSIELTGLPAGTWTINPGAISGSGSTYTISGLSAGTYHYTVTNSVGCTSPISADAIIITSPVTPSAPVVDAIIQPTCSEATGSVQLSGLPAGTWIINPGAITGTGNSTTITHLIPKTYHFTVTNDAGCVSLPTADVVIIENPGTPPTPQIASVTQPSCSVATGSVTLSGLPSGTWTLNPGGLSGSGGSTTISGLLPGTYNYTVTNGSGCISLVSASFTINPQPVTPATPIVGAVTQPTCVLATGSVVLSGLPAGNWVIDPGAVAGTGASKTLSGLAAGTYNFTVTNDVGCPSVPTADVVIVAATPTAPVIGTIIQPTCSVSTGSVDLNGLPTGSWTINPGGINGTGLSYTKSGLNPGTYTYTVKNALGCTSPASAPVVINAQPVTPSKPNVGTITQPTCSVSTGSVVLSSLPAGNWTLNPGNITGTGASYTVAGLSAGTYNFTVTNDVGCTSAASNNVVINVQPVTPSAPTIGTVTQPSCSSATGSIILNGLPSGNYTINPDGINGNTTSKTISNIDPGTYNYTVTNAAGCTSVATAGVVIIANAGTPAKPAVGTVTQPTCDVATGSIAFSNLPSSGTWTINPGAFTGSGTTTVISGIVAGTNRYTVTNDAGCISNQTGNVTINTQPVTPGAPVVGAITQPTCTVATGSVVLSGLPSGNWTINPGNITGNTSSKTVTGLIAGTYNFTVTNNAGCTSSATADVVINPQPVTPSAPTIGAINQTTCAVSTGSVTLNDLPAGNWTINPGSISGTGSSKFISGLTAGTLTFTVTNSVGCASPASASVVINTQPATPAAPTIGTVTQPTCSVGTGSVVLSGLPAGSWIINPGAIAGSGGSKTLSGIVPGTYNFTVTNASGCTSLASANVVINAQLATPAAPTVGPITQPTCTVATGSVILTGLPLGNWTINPGAIVGTGVSTTISGLAAGTYNYTVTNASGCTSLASANIVINAQPATPSAPVAGTITQPSCSLATGSVLLNGLPAGTWTLNPGGISGNTPNTTLSGLINGTYNYTVTNASGCTSAPSANIVINPQPLTPTAPSVGTITQPTCTLAAGSAILSGLPAGTWTINPGGITGSGSNTTLSGLATGTYNFTVTNASGCTSGASVNVVINPQPITPSAPILSVTSQPGCSVATGNIEISGLPSGNWMINPGTISGTGTNKTLTGLTAGTYAYTVTNSVGCVSSVSANAVINVQPVTPAAPTASSIMQPTCATATGKIVLNGLPAGTWTLNPGSITGTGSSTTLPGLNTGTYVYTVTNSSGCTSPNSANFVIDAQPETPTAPIIGSVTQPTCTVATGSVVFTGLPAGNWTINPGSITGSGSSITLTGIAAGTYYYTVTNSVGCVSPQSLAVIINPQPATPSAIVVGTITQPTCDVSTGSVDLSGMPSGNWTINPGAISGSGPGTTISNLNPGTYTYTVTGEFKDLTQQMLFRDE